MNCAACGHTNPERAKFCLECGAPFAARCASCGIDLPPAAKFCLECGTPTAGSAAKSTLPPAAAAEPADSRKIVTIVFADLVGSTALHERLEPESARRFMESYYAAMRGAVESQGGTVTQLLGDGVKAVFGIPRVAEDDAIRAVRAAAAMQDAFRALAEQQRDAVGQTGLRVAVNTGEVVANDATEIIGDPVNVAARLQEQGKDGDVVVGESTHRLVSTLVTLELLGSFALKGRSEAVKAYRVVSLERPAGAATAPFVGRDEELGRLDSVYDTATGKPATGLVVLVGSPGLGKSRLIDEFARRHAEAATVVQAHCDAAGGATFAPLAQALRALLGIEDGAGAAVLRATLEAALPGDDADRARIAGGIAALLSGSPASPEETFFVVRRLLGAIAQRKPVVLVIDDLHWAEPLLLDLVEHLVQWGSGVPLLVVIGARPELRDLRSSLVTPGGLVADVITLSGLDAGAAMRLAANVIGAADLPAAIAAKVLATSEGNPLFVGELVRMLVQEGALTKQGDRWTAGANLAALEMPPTIHALLAARIERLRPEERGILEHAAVVGRHFSRSAVAALLPHDAGDLDARLEALRRSELIERDTGWLLGEPVLRFHHVLIRDAAYRRLLKGTRAELHAKLADWIEAQVGDAPEHDETIGWHLEQAHQFLRELGPVDASGARLGERAATRLAAAGRRALASDDLAVAADLLGRAIDRLGTDDAARAELALDWCEALLAGGDVGPAAAAIDELARFATDSERLKAWHTCFTGQHTVLTAPSALHATADTVAGAAAALTSLGDAAGEAKAHFVHALALSRLGKVGDCEAALDRALAAARRAGDRRRANTVLAIAPLAALWGPSPVTRASGRCLDVVRVLRITQGAPAVEAVALSCQGVLEALRGRTEAARRMIASARKMVEELGITQRLLETDVFGGLVELLEGDAPAAERSLRGAYEGLRELGLGIDAARAAALLARALLAQDRVAEAEALSHESESLAGDDLKAAIAWRGVRAEALAKRGEHAAAVEFASKAVELAAATDALLDHADARLALAAAMRAAGRRGDADAEERHAKELWQAKGATLLAERATHTAAPVAASVAAAAPRAAQAPRRRPVRPNFAVEEMRRAEAAVAARDARALEAVYRRDVEIVDHQFGITYGHAAIVERVRAVIEDSTESAFAHEPLASLGDSLALCRMRSTASGSTVHGIPVGATDVPYLLLIEADERGSARHIEIFGDDRLADAVARLYERHAAQLPEGAARERAAATARCVETFVHAMPDVERWATAFAPDVAVADHRTAGVGIVRGRAEWIATMQALVELSSDVTYSQEDILGLRPDGLLVACTNRGRDRVGGGLFERSFLLLAVFGAEGRITRLEQFDLHHDADAMPRFEALTGAPPPPPGRHVRANAATRGYDRTRAAIVARDADALAELFDESLTVVHHPTRAAYGRRGMLATWRSTLKAEHFAFRQEILASLGDTLALDHHLVSVEGLREAHLAAIGAAEFDEISLLEVDASGRWLRSEIFAADRLGDALARFYERYAEQLPEGAARGRAEATARSVAVVAPGGSDRDRYAAAFRPDVEIVDHRLLGLGSGVGLEMLFRSMAAASEVGDQLVSRPMDVLALTDAALLLRWLSSGVGRESGGAFEWAFLRLFVFDAEGRVSRYELFDVDREAEARARFEALAAGPAQPQPIARRVRPNRATAAIARFDAACVARDLDAAAAQHRADFEETDHPTGTSYPLAGARDGLRRLLRARDPHMVHEPLATLGEALLIARRSTCASASAGGRFDVGAWAREEWIVAETDANERLVATEIFAGDRLGDAIVRLYERHAAQQPEGLERERATATARSVAAWSGPADLGSLKSSVAASFECVDHRPLHTWSSRGRDEWLRHWEVYLHDLTSDARLRDHDVLALGPSALLVRRAYSGIERSEGGAYENLLLMLLAFDEDGLLTCVEGFEPDHETEALARFDAMVGRDTQVPAEPFANAASRLVARGMHELWAVRDWDAILAMISPAIRMDDRRRIVRLEIGYDAFVAQFRMLFDQPGSRWRERLLATRGERLSLTRTRFEAEVADGGGPLAFDDHLSLAELDAEGRIVAFVTFDLEDEDAAYAELDARYDVLEAELHPRMTAVRVAQRRPYLDRDWEAFASTYARDVVCHDHRLLGWGTLHGIDAWLRTQRALVELAPDMRVRNEHVVTAERGFLVSALISGTRDGGAFELAFLRVNEIDAAGKMCRIDLYDIDDVDRARARFAELATPARTEQPFANAASRAGEENAAVWMAADWERFAGLFPADSRLSDRRRAVQLELGREELIAFSRALGEHATTRTIHVETLATRGEWLALQRWRIELAGDGVGASEISHLTLMERDERGIGTGTVRWDEDEIEAARAELDARFEAGEGAAHPHALASHVATNAAIRSRDWDALAARCAPRFRMRDHRLLGWGTTVNDAATFVRVIRSAVELAPDARYRDDHLRICARGTLARMVLCGSREGGAFENPFLRVTEVDEQGRILCHDLYDESDCERALARFAEIRASERPDPLPTLVKPNLATAAMERNWTAFDALDLDAADAARDAARAHYAPDFVWDDRRPLVGLSGDLDLMFASVRERLVMGARQQRTIVATAGDRVAIGRVLWAGGPADGRFEVEFLVVSEVNEAGLFTALVFFEPGDTRAAQREAWARWAAIDSAVAPWVELLNAIHDAWNGRDRAGLLARFAADVVVEDHRHAGIGRIEGAAAYVDANAVLWDLAPDQRIEFGSAWLAFDRHGLVVTLRRLGTLADGGAFENEYVWLSLARSGRVTRLELFEVEQRDAALARFEELRPDPLRIPPNAAARAVGRIAPLYANADLPALRAIVSDDFVFDDRTRGSLLRGGVEEWVNGIRFLRTETRALGDTRLVATAGDRLVLNHLSWRETPGESSFLIERFGLYEIDATGKLRAFVLFDAGDRAAAHTELFERYVALGAEGMPACLVEFGRALEARDLERARAVLADDFVYHDRRRTGAGRLDGPDAYLASPRAWWELSTDAQIDALYTVAIAPHGRVVVNRMAGRNLEGGDFESFMVTLVSIRADCLAGVEIFEIDQLDAALARLEELRPDPLRLQPTAATRMRDRHRDAFIARDWDAVRALTGAEFVFEDRGKRALVHGDVGAWIASMEFTTQPGFRSDSALIGTLGDRIVLDRIRWFGKPGGDAFEFERVRLLEVGADGLLRAALFFDPEDRFAASIEGLVRFAAGEAAGSAGIAPMLALGTALQDRDWEAARDCYAPDAVLLDHRPLGFGALDRDEWIAALRASDDLSVSLGWDAVRILTWSEQGFVVGIRRLGTIAAGGGPFENDLHLTALVANGRFQRYELFGEADPERAVARFAELCAEPGA